jgi:methionyl-tRNA formyltransferase
MSGVAIHNLIRGLSPYPAAWCFFSDKNEEWTLKYMKLHYYQNRTILREKYLYPKGNENSS